MVYSTTAWLVAAVYFTCDMFWIARAWKRVDIRVISSYWRTDEWSYSGMK